MVDFCEAAEERYEALCSGGHGRTFVLDSENVRLRDCTWGPNNVQDEDIMHLSLLFVLLATTNSKRSLVSVAP
jgi:hypothetical protein